MPAPDVAVAVATTIANNQTKQVSMLEGTDVPTVKRYVVEGNSYYYHNARHPGSPIKDNVEVYYQFKNEQKAGLGMPMPAGIVRVYQQDSKGGVQFVGEDRIMHTPKDETLNIKIGNAFDVVCERNQIDRTTKRTSLRTHDPSTIAKNTGEPGSSFVARMGAATLRRLESLRRRLWWRRLGWIGRIGEDGCARP